MTQAFRFGLVGVVGAVVDYGSLLVMVGLGLWDSPARALSFAAGSTTAYLLNRRWTFTSKRNAREAAAVAVVYAMTFALIVGAYAAADRLLPASPWHLTLAWAVSQGIGTTFNFLAQRTLVFRR
ncbi:GtrA family protein [Saccharopolyspora erythraea]|nr:GtrA family protein [Saccharopolyspora erythraea]